MLTFFSLPLFNALRGCCFWNADASPAHESPCALHAAAAACSGASVLARRHAAYTWGEWCGFSLGLVDDGLGWVDEGTARVKLMDVDVSHALTLVFLGLRGVWELSTGTWGYVRHDYYCILLMPSWLFVLEVITVHTLMAGFTVPPRISSHSFLSQRALDDLKMEPKTRPCPIL